MSFFLWFFFFHRGTHTRGLLIIVRIKVSSWVSNFVSEMRTKSPAVVQKWVDSLPNEENVTDIPCDKLHTDTIADDHDQIDETNNLNETAELSEKNSECTNDANIVQITEQIIQLHVHQENDTHSETGEYDTESQDTQPHDSIDSVIDNTSNDRRFWTKTPSILTSLRIRTSLDSIRRTEETEDLTALHPLLAQSDEPNINTPTNPLSNKSKLNDFYHKLSINKKRYNFLRDRKMEAKKLLNNAKSRFLAATNWDELKSEEVATSDEHDHEHEHEHEHEHGHVEEQHGNADDERKDSDCDQNVTKSVPLATTVISEPEASGTASVVCDTIDMDLSADEFSRLSQSNDILSVDDEDSFNVSMPSINDGHASHLNVGRRIPMADIGRSTSDNPRLRNKFYLADIGRSFSEHQDEEIMIGERNISAPSSSIAIQNNNRSNGNFYERRAYSVSPTQRGLKRGVLSRDHSLSDSSRHRNQLSKGSSFQSDSSHCSSVESLLDARKPDSEAILRQLGFGPAHQEDLLSRIPKRYAFFFVFEKAMFQNKFRCSTDS